MSENEQSEGFTFNDKRRIDPETGQVRGADASGLSDANAPAGAGQPAPAAGGSETGFASDTADAATDATGDAPQEGDVLDPIDAEAAQLVADDRAGLESRIAELEDELKRSQAEYVNSRRRIENQAAANVEVAVQKVLEAVIPVLDDIELARQHGDLADGTPFASIATKLEDSLARFGLARFGEAGEAFDPGQHEALMHNQSPDATEETIQMVMQPGYKVGEKVVRPARVGVVGP